MPVRWATVVIALIVLAKSVNGANLLVSDFLEYFSNISMFCMKKIQNFIKYKA